MICAVIPSAELYFHSRGFLKSQIASVGKVTARLRPKNGSQNRSRGSVADLLNFGKVRSRYFSVPFCFSFDLLVRLVILRKQGLQFGEVIERFTWSQT
jgi:hypothetical protein